MKRKTFISLIVAAAVLLVCAAAVFATETRGYYKTYLRGDVTMDDKITTGDATWILRYCAIPRTMEFTEFQTILGDANDDGIVNTGDATYILRIVVGLEEQLYYEHYIEEEYTLTFDAGEGVLTNMPEEMTDGSIKILEKTNILGYLVGENAVRAELGDADFLGWMIDGKLIDNTYASYPIESDLTAVAVYNEHRLLTFDAGEGEIVNAPDNMTNGKLTFTEDTDIISYLVGDTAIRAERDGYNFLGWSIDGTLIDRTYATYMLTESKTATAVYEEIREADITIVYYDSFNEIDPQITKTQSFLAEPFTLTGDMLELPEGYKLDGPFSAQINCVDGTFSPATVRVNVYPYTMLDGEEFKIIYTIAGFMKVQDNLDINYILGNDIDMGSINKFIPFGWDWENVQNADTYFTGIFEGNGYTITNLHIDLILAWQTDVEYYYNINVGLFAVNQGEIRNLNVYTRPFAGDYDNYGVYGDVNVGVVAGYNDGLIYNCHAFGNVGSYDYVEEPRGAVGGVCGTNNGTVIYSSFEGGVEGFYYAGGVAGKNFGTIDQCYFAGGINWDCTAEFLYTYDIRYVGGICGGSQYATIKNSYAYLTHDVRTNYAVGGISGWIKGGTLQNCFVVNPDHLKYVSDYRGDLVGYIVEMPTYSGLYVYPGTSGLPTGYGSETWDMNGASYSTVPDLVKNRRGASFHNAIDY